MTHKVTDPVALDIIADHLSSRDWVNCWDEVLQDIADVVEATGRSITTDKESSDEAIQS